MYTYSNEWFLKSDYDTSCFIPNLPVKLENFFSRFGIVQRASLIHQSNLKMQSSMTFVPTRAPDSFLWPMNSQKCKCTIYHPQVSISYSVSLFHFIKFCHVYSFFLMKFIIVVVQEVYIPGVLTYKLLGTDSRKVMRNH